jgi:iron complex transport system substrate-binding protein
VLKKTIVALTAIILVLVITVSSYSVYRLYSPPETSPQQGTITVEDGTGTQVTINTPVNRVVTLNDGLTEVVCALGCEDKIVGRESTSLFPSSILEKPSVGESYAPNVEVLLELNPGLVIADSMLTYNNETRGQIEAAGIPVFIIDTANPQPDPNSNETIIDVTSNVVSKLGLILNKEGKANEIIDYLQYYKNLVNERIESLEPNEEKPIVYYEFINDWMTAVIPSVTQAGGVNIAANESTYAPTLSPEYVAEKNPDIIIRMISSPNHNETDFKTMRDEILNRPGLGEVTAVKEGKVYVCDYEIRGGIRCVVGWLQWAKWIQPNLFEDIDPAAVHAQLIQKFFGVALEGVYAYP